MSPAAAGWVPYPTGTWHAYQPESIDSMCGMAQREPGRDGCPGPSGRACQRCRALVNSRPGRQEPHRAIDRCACPVCRRARKAGAVQFLDELRARLLRAVPRDVRAWPEAARYVAPVEARLGALLLAWELDGASAAVLGADLSDAEHELFDAWRAAERAFERYGGPRAT